jgi:nucleoside-diphosphate-sugar epimerase
MSRILVTDAEQRAALAVARSLGAAGYEVHVCGARRRTLAGASRHVRGTQAVPDPLHSPGEYLDAVERLRRAW